MVRARLLTGAVPVLVRVRVRLAEAPMAMLPKLRAEGAMTRCDWTPMPVSGTLMDRLEREVSMARGLARVPMAGRVEVRLLKVGGVEAVLVICRGRVEVAPSWTEPKSRAMGETMRGDGVAVP